MSRWIALSGQQGPAPVDEALVLVIGTRKGLWFLASDPDRRVWWASEPEFLGHIIQHAVLDPRDGRTLLVATSTGHLGPTVFRSTDFGRSWSEAARPPAFATGEPLARALRSVFWLTPGHVSEPDFSHDPHCVRLHPQLPDRLYQQNHCGIYRLDRPDTTWTRIGEQMPRDVGDVGFSIELHPRDPDTVWVMPMDGTDVWPRTSPDGRPAVYVTRDAGGSWQRLASGLPDRGWLTVKRQAMTVDRGEPVGVYFGTTGGEVWGSADEGESWSPIVRHLPEIYTVEPGVGIA